MGRLSGIQAAEVDDDDNGINDVFDEVIARNEELPRDKQYQHVDPADETTYKIDPLRGQFIGSWMAWDEELRGLTNEELMNRQHFIQSLYESRSAALQRFVSFLVMFHALGKAVMDFWPRVTCGIFGYDMSRTHSIMRIATTASPVSGMEVREKTLELAESTAKAFAERIMQSLAAHWFVEFAESNHELGQVASNSPSFRARAAGKVTTRKDAMMAIIYGGGNTFNMSFKKSASFKRVDTSDDSSESPKDSDDEPDVEQGGGGKSILAMAETKPVVQFAEAPRPAVITPPPGASPQPKRSGTKPDPCILETKSTAAALETREAEKKVTRMMAAAERAAHMDKVEMPVGNNEALTKLSEQLERLEQLISPEKYGKRLNGHGLNGHGLNGHGLNGNGLNGHGLNGHGLNGLSEKIDLADRLSEQLAAGRAALEAARVDTDVNKDLDA